MMKRIQPTGLPGKNRRGVTLTEVLMSMLIMAIGVSFVAAVFPLSLLRSIQGAQMTGATILRFQAEALISTFPDMIHNPDGHAVGAGPDGVHGTGDDAGDKYREHFGRDYIIDPWGYHVHAGDGTTFDAGNQNLSDWLGVDRFDVGWMRRYDGGIAAQTNPGAPAGEWSAHLEQVAATLASTTDKWDKEVDTDQIESFTDAGVAASSLSGLVLLDADLSNFPDPRALFAGSSQLLPDTEIARITIFHEDGRHSQTFPVTHISGQQVWWSEDFDDDGSLGAGEDLDQDGFLDARTIPLRFRDGAGNLDTATISHVTLEFSQMRLFSWLMSVRKRGDGNASVDVAVIFNRLVDLNSEIAYRATFVPGTNIVGVRYDAAVEAEPPFLKRGGYVFDAVNCRWYRIQQFREQPAFGSWDFGDYEFVLFTETQILEAAGEDTYVPPAGTGFPLNSTLDVAEGEEDDGDDDGDGDDLDYGRAVFLPGVIEVYSLGVIPVPEGL